MPLKAAAKFIPIMFLVWDWTNAPQNIVFNVYHSTNVVVTMPRTVTNTAPPLKLVPLEQWPRLYSGITNRRIMLVLDKPVDLFYVRALNTTNHQESRITK